MKQLIILAATLFFVSACSHRVENVGKVTERVKAVSAMRSDVENVYMRLILEKKKGNDEIEETRWLRASKEAFWKGSKPSTIYQSKKVRERYPPVVEYDGEEYEIFLGNLSQSVSKEDGYGTWKLITEPTQLTALDEVEKVQQKSGTQIDPQNPIFGESKSDLFLFVYPDRVPEVVLLDHEENKALVIREFRHPSSYTITDDQYDTFKSAAMPVTKTVDVGAVILASPVLVPILLNADFSGK